MERKTDKEYLTLYDVLANPVWRQLFKRHLQTIYCEESLNFLESVDTYRKCSNQIKRYAVASNISNYFLKAKSFHQINVSSEERMRAMSKIYKSQMLDQDLFDELYEVVETQLREEHLPRFRASKFFTELNMSDSWMQDSDAGIPSPGADKLAYQSTFNSNESNLLCLTDKDFDEMLGKLDADIWKPVTEKEDFRYYKTKSKDEHGHKFLRSELLLNCDARMAYHV